MVYNDEGEEPAGPPAKERVEQGIRYVIAGHREASIRRIVLYVIAILGVVVTYFLNADWTAVFPASLSITALLILGLTDQLA